jgi:hypothetical protein
MKSCPRCGMETRAAVMSIDTCSCSFPCFRQAAKFRLIKAAAAAFLHKTRDDTFPTLRISEKFLHQLCSFGALIPALITSHGALSCALQPECRPECRLDGLAFLSTNEDVVVCKATARYKCSERRVGWCPEAKSIVSNQRHALPRRHSALPAGQCAW